MPNLSQILSDAQIWEIMKYLKTEALDVTQLYDAIFTGTYPTGSASYTNIEKDGNADAGKYSMHKDVQLAMVLMERHSLWKI